MVAGHIKGMVLSKRSLSRGRRVISHEVVGRALIAGGVGKVQVVRLD